MNYFQLLKRLYDLYDSNVGKEVDYKFIIKQIRKQIPFRECKIIGIRTLSIASNNLMVSGVYNPNLDEAKYSSPITIEIALPRSKETFWFDESDLSRTHWGNLCIDVIGVLGHEFIHLRQFRRRKFRQAKEYRSKLSCPRSREIQKYYGHPDEIEAFAFVAAADLILQCVTKKIKTPDIQKATLYRIYLSFFDKDDPVVVKFTKLTNRYYKRLERQYHDTPFE